MCKRVVIGVLAIIGVAVLVFVVSQPRKGSVKYHIAEYRAAEHELNGKRTLIDAVREKCRDLLELEDPGSPEIRRDTHIKALLDLGYLEKREFCLQHVARSEAYRPLMDLAAKELPRDRVWRIRDSEMYIAFVVEAEPRDMAKWREMIRKVDPP